MAIPAWARGILQFNPVSRASRSQRAAKTPLAAPGPRGRARPRTSEQRARAALRADYPQAPGAEGALVLVMPKFAKDDEESAALRRATTAPAFAHRLRFDNGGPWAPAHRKRRADSQRRRSTILPAQTPKIRTAGPKHPGNKSGRGEQTAAAARLACAKRTPRRRGRTGNLR